jgi:predicted GNAT family acetyltransferase
MQSSNLDTASEVATEEYLVNPVWIALTAAPPAFVERREGAARDKPDLPPGFDVVREAVANQMVAPRTVTVSSDKRIARLGVDDTADMLRLAGPTEPGPFNARTNELGHFFGIKESGERVAMAGERMTAGKYLEISAVCTHPEWHGRGLGRLLMEHLSATFQERNKVPFFMCSPTTFPPFVCIGNSAFALPEPCN